MRYNKIITFPFDLKERAAAELMRVLAIEVTQPIFLSKDNREINLNSLLGVLSLGIKKGDLVVISSHSEEALNKTISIINKEA